MDAGLGLYPHTSSRKLIYSKKKRKNKEWKYGECIRLITNGSVGITIHQILGSCSECAQCSLIAWIAMLISEQI